MRRIVWYQFSDLHFGPRPDYDRGIVLEALWKDISERQNAGLIPDFVTVTGDIAWSGKEEEYEQAEREFFLPLVDRLGVPRDNIFMVPGNHDVDREEISTLNAGAIISLSNREQVNNFISVSKTLRRYLIGFENYNKFVERITGGEFEGLGTKHQLIINGVRISILGFNTAWASGYDTPGRGDEQGHLFVGERQVRDLLPKQDDTDLVLVLMHHPIGWLADHDRAAVEQILAERCDILLHGHVHRPSEMSSIATVAGGYLSLGSGAAYERRVGTEPFVNCYSVVDFDADSRAATVTVRKYTDTPTPKWISHEDLLGEGSRGIRTFSIPSSSGAHQKPVSTRGAQFTSISDLILPVAGASSKALASASSHANRRSGATDLLAIFDDLVLLWANGLGVKSDQELGASVLLCREIITRWDRGATEIHEAVVSSLSKLCEISEIAQRRQMLERYKSLWDHIIEDFSAPLDVNVTSSGAEPPPAAIVPIFFALCLILLGDSTLAARVIRKDIPGRTPAGEPVPLRSATGAKLHDGTAFISVSTPTLAEFSAVSVIRHYLDARLEGFVDEFSAVNEQFPLTALSLHFIEKPKEWTEHRFAVDPARVLRILMGEALYGAKSEDVWFRELLQNAIDATAARARIGSDPKFRRSIKFQYDNLGRKVRFVDNGIGMTQDHIFRFFCRAGRSIWRTEELEGARGEGSATPSRISLGKFGVGFLSVFQVATRVEVKTAFFKAPKKGHVLKISGIEEPFFLQSWEGEDGGTEVVVDLQPGYQPNLASLVGRYITYAPKDVALSGFPKLAPSPEVALDELIESTMKDWRGVRRHLQWEKSTVHLPGLEATLYVAVPMLWNTGEGRATDRTYIPVETHVRVSNGGITVISQTSLWLGDDTQNDWEISHVNGVRVLLDFAAGAAPVTVSRNSLTLTEGDAEAVLEGIKSAVIASWQSYAETVFKIDDKEVATKRLIRALGNSARSVYWDYRWTRDHDLELAARDLLLSKGEVAVYEGSGLNTPTRRALLDLSSDDRDVSVLSQNQKDDRLIQLYSSKSKNFCAIFGGSEREIKLLALCGENWKKLASEDELWTAIKIDEDRELALNRYIPADVAIAGKEYFADEEDIFLILPTRRARAEVVEGLCRAEVRDIRPRVLLNRDHALVADLEGRVGDDPSLARQVRECFDYLIAGVVEEPSKGRRSKRKKDVMERLDAMRSR